MIDRSDFKPEHLELWDETFPEGIEEGASEEDTPHMRLYAFGYVCLLEVGSVPKPVSRELGDMPRWVNEYMERVRRSRR